jgi:hypothetical protein
VDVDQCVPFSHGEDGAVLTSCFFVSYSLL